MKFLQRLFGSGKSEIEIGAYDRDPVDVSRDLTPARVDAIMQAANSGDVADQCRLAREVLEKNHDILQALSTRRNAVLGCRYRFAPGDDSPRAEQAAAALTSELEQSGDLTAGLDTFDEMLEDLLGALLPGFAVSEIIWKKGGAIAGFKHIPQSSISFRDGFWPKLITDHAPQGIELAPEKIIFQRLRLHGSDPARGGLVRPLAWLHCFGQINVKNLLGFIERHGMPFLIFRTDEATFQTERNVLKRLIRNFGSSGGALITKNVETELLQATQTGEVYFRLLGYVEAAISKILLGQTASSGDSAGLSGGDAQSRVRQDILEADCRWLERAVNRQLVLPWMRYNFGPGVAPPRLAIDCGEPADDKADAEVIQLLYSAGLDPDPEEMSKRFGYKLARREIQPAGGLPPMLPQAFPGDGAPAPELNLGDKYNAMGVAIRAGLLTATPEIEEIIRAELGLPGLSPAVKQAWEATGGIRQPITLKTNDAPAAPVAPGDEKALSDIPAADPDEWSDEALDAAVAKLGAATRDELQPEALAEKIEATLVRGFVAGAVAEDRKLAGKGAAS